MIAVDRERCCYCGGCVSVCPEGAIHLRETRIVIEGTCTECGLCLSACPVGALYDRQTTGRAMALPIAEPPRLAGQRYDLIVVGAGPGGAVAAREAAARGLSVLLLEKRQEIGSPVRCAEGIAHGELVAFLAPDASWISSTVDRAQIVASVGGQIVETWEGHGGLGYVLERRVFDRTLAQRAALAGAQVCVKTAATGLLRDGGVVCGVVAGWQNHTFDVEAGVTIAADGVESQVGSWAGLNTRLPLQDTMVCAQYLLAGIEWDPACLGYWIDEAIAPGGYAWVFPKGEGRANVGLGVQADLGEATALSCLDRFVESQACLAPGRPVTLIAGNVPVAEPCSSLVTDGLMLVGDAGRQVDPLTGGGIINAMQAGRLAAQVAAQAVKNGDSSAQALAPYQERFELEKGRRLRRNYHLRQRYDPSQRASRRFVRLFAVAAAGK